MDKSAHGQMYIEGVTGALDLAIIKLETKKFSAYLKQYNLSDFNSLQTEFVDHLRKHGIPAEMYSDSIEINKLSHSTEPDYNLYERKNFVPLSVKLKNNRLLLLNIIHVGAVRIYYSMAPLGAPIAVYQAEGRLIDLTDNKTLWRFSTEQKVKVEGKWDQPPQYPNFTRALDKAASQANQAIINDFFSNVANLQ